LVGPGLLFRRTIEIQFNTTMVGEGTKRRGRRFKGANKGGERVRGLRTTKKKGGGALEENNESLQGPNFPWR
jgi:hypothetical protein